MDTDLTGKEILSKFIDQENLDRFEGTIAIKNLNKLCSSLDPDCYSEESFLYGPSLELFLQDNSGACDALLQWIESWMDKCEHWKVSLSKQLKESEDE